MKLLAFVFSVLTFAAMPAKAGWLYTYDGFTEPQPMVAGGDPACWIFGFTTACGGAAQVRLVLTQQGGSLDLAFESFEFHWWPTEHPAVAGNHYSWRLDDAEIAAITDPSRCDASGCPPWEIVHEGTPDDFNVFWHWGDGVGFRLDYNPGGTAPGTFFVNEGLDRFSFFGRLTLTSVQKVSEPAPWLLALPLAAMLVLARPRS
jgi:hypothetical protein